MELKFDLHNCYPIDGDEWIALLFCVRDNEVVSVTKTAYGKRAVPGGKKEPYDRTPADTAYREFVEEVITPGAKCPFGVSELRYIAYGVHKKLARFYYLVLLDATIEIPFTDTSAEHDISTPSWVDRSDDSLPWIDSHKTVLSYVFDEFLKPINL